MLVTGHRAVSSCSLKSNVILFTLSAVVVPYLVEITCINVSINTLYLQYILYYTPNSAKFKQLMVRTAVEIRVYFKSSLIKQVIVQISRLLATVFSMHHL